VFLVGDLTECQLENVDKAEPPFFSNRFFLKSVVDLMASGDLDLQEKVVDHLSSLGDAWFSNVD
jgi:hsp70-interacting protein